MSGNLVNYLADFFAKFVQSDKQLFDHLCQSVPREGEQLPMRPCFDHPRTVIRDSEREMASPFQELTITSCLRSLHQWQLVNEHAMIF
ncbi:hypothetical protein NC651_024683 [Populus alba x Populus x berolinensis]|nr:hypothetical protein NC651_024683 [Populus alba x Populus x berolinensis]